MNSGKHKLPLTHASSRPPTDGAKYLDSSVCKQSVGDDLTYRFSARFYDLFGSKDDLEFYKELALQSGDNALELGVGTARVAIPLAREGVRVVGIDNSEYMLKVAREKLVKESESVRDLVNLERGDMKKFELGQTFDLIYIPASTFDHCVTDLDRKQCLGCIHKHLKGGGSLAFDIEQATLERPKASWWVDRKEIKEDMMVVRTIFMRRDFDKRICSLDLFFDSYYSGKLVERYHEYGEVAILFKDEVEDLLEQSGFKVEAVYGDFDKSEPQKDSPRAVFLTSKR
ncbi:MAG: class I SAM-dependent methyltransferase [Candidatus Bathyarchaeota archaeon]|nr:MAG: class I SAM-dependent methyltransferase [Candidatus Bathyarchaeota archaeon]